ncbi:MAG: S8 family serine peptidase [Anaerolineales bacterium]|nr:S8 family serine peptidase [Anaerolineales bacterium]MCB8937283.1 S8 family serine peptidase [Ardenticatenaceae bacterium]
MTDDLLPAWSDAFTADAVQPLPLTGAMSAITRDWAWGGSTGKGIRVAVIDSGIESDHPALGGAVQGGVGIDYDPSAPDLLCYVEEPRPQDVFGHGTACAGIIHALAPEAALYSVRVLGGDGRGRSLQFAAGINWAIANGMQVVNMSLSTSSEEYFGLFHQLADEAYFHGVTVVSAVNNDRVPSYPSLYSSVISVAAHEKQDPFTFYYNAKPPVEFGAPGIDVRVAWTNKGYITTTGNSFAAPHVAGIVALIRAKHPNLTPFQIKTILHACASNVGEAADK